ncbi:MAG: N-acetylneuraminate synthase [Spirochaetae bacterium HGW-Spirochaetae-5]|nr:MAG: N-acetylneuraminate synthase [Spirochaetae bacterium HGW-Spirochaetae-5]
MVKKYYILGGGITGLVLEYELLKKGQIVEIIERDMSVGGLAKSFEWRGRMIDLGPHIYHTPNDDILSYWGKEFRGLFCEREHWSKNLRLGKLYDYPISNEFIEGLPKEIKEKILNELDHCNSAELTKATTYYEYIRALAGETLQDMFFMKYPEKVWGLSTKELDANWAPKRIEIRKQRSPFYWGQWSAVGNKGSGTIIDSLKEKVFKLGGSISLLEEVKNIVLDDDRIKKIETSKRDIFINNNDVVINTTSYTQIAKILKIDTTLKYRGIRFVFLAINKIDVFPEGVDFIYIDDPSIYFNRISDQNSFVKDPVRNSTVICCEITFSKGDFIDQIDDETLAKSVTEQFAILGFCKKEDIVDSKVVKVMEVYPMFFLGYQNALSITKSKIDKISNMYTIGSLAEYAYTDMQVLFGKAIDLAEILTNKTFKMNQINKTIPRLNFNKKVIISNSIIGEGEKTYIVAEIGLNHNGVLSVAKKLIDEAISVGADAVKLQSYKSENRVAENGKTSRYVERILGMEETDFEMFKKNELSYQQVKELFEYAKGKITIFSAPFDTESVDELEQLGIDFYKIASFDLVNLPLIKKVALTGKPIILSTGMSSLAEVEEALRVIANCDNKNVILLHCTSSYPAPPENMNIRAIDTMRMAFQVPVGLSDHVIGDHISLAAVARGANIIEKHFTLDKRMEGPDHVLSVEPREFKDLITRVRSVEQSLGTGIKQASPDEISTMIRFRKTMYINKTLQKGSSITENDIVYKGPAYGLYSKFEDFVVGQKVNRDVEADTPLTWDLFNNMDANNVR